jgi:hypothetical protein
VSRLVEMLLAGALGLPPSMMNSSRCRDGDFMTCVPFEATQHEACSIARPRGGFCAGHHDPGVLQPGPGLSEFVSRMRSTKSITVKIVGNSVARWNTYLAARAFCDGISVRWPGINVTFPQQNPGYHKSALFDHDDLSTDVMSELAAGGHGPEHTFCSLGVLEDADVVLVMYGAWPSGGDVSAYVARQRELFQRLLALPNAPLVVAIRHCSLLDFELHMGGAAFVVNATSATARRDKCRVPFDGVYRNKACRQERSERFIASLPALGTEARQTRSEEGAMLTELGVTSVDVCRLLASTHSGACVSQPYVVQSMYESSHHDASAFDVFQTGRAFSLDANKMGDPVHPMAEHAIMQGCAAAKLLTLATPANTSLHPTQAHSYARQRKESSSWCLMAGARAPATMRLFHGCPPCLMVHTAGREVSNVIAPANRSCAAGADGFDASQPDRCGCAVRASPHSPTRSRDWRLRVGGAGGSKRWLEALSSGSTLTLMLPVSAPRLLIEYYAHDDKPLADASVRLEFVAVPGRHADGTCASPRTLAELPPVLIDTADCRGCLPHQGFYQVRELLGNVTIWAALLMRHGGAALIRAHRVVHGATASVMLRVSIKVVTRDDQANFSLAAVIGAPYSM